MDVHVSTNVDVRVWLKGVLSKWLVLMMGVSLREKNDHYAYTRCINGGKD